MYIEQLPVRMSIFGCAISTNRLISLVCYAEASKRHAFCHHDVMLHNFLLCCRAQGLVLMDPANGLVKGPQDSFIQEEPIRQVLLPAQFSPSACVGQLCWAQNPI